MYMVSFGIGKMFRPHGEDGTSCRCLYDLSSPYLSATWAYRTRTGIFALRPDIGMRHLIRFLLEYSGYPGAHLYTSTPMQTAADVLHFSALARHARDHGVRLSQKDVQRYFAVCADLERAYRRKGWDVPTLLQSPPLY